jgi:1-acyl-sn-glycerol-3-phosphate acyltransferase
MHTVEQPVAANDTSSHHLMADHGPTRAARTPWQIAASFGRLAASAAITLPWLAAAAAVRRVDKRAGHRCFAAWGAAQQRLFGIDFTVEDRNLGRYDRPPYLFVLLNQGSLAEVFMLHAAVPRPFSFVMNIGFALLPIYGWGSALNDAAVLVRQWPWQTRRVLARAVVRMRQGHDYGISIEGNRSANGTLQPYKKGPSVLAIQAQATIVPLYFHGSRDLMPVGAWRIRPGRVRAVLCEAIETSGLTHADRDALTQRLREVAEREART